MATKVLTNARGYSYSTTPGSSSFHQDGDRYQDLEKVYTTGAYGPSTDWNKYASAYQGNNSSSKDSGSKTSSGSTTANIDTSALSGGYSGGGGSDYAASLQAMLEEQLARQRAISDAAYEESIGRLNETWENTQGSLGRNLDSTLNRLKSQLDYSSGIVNEDANKSLREAYINYMMNKKNLNQGLTAMGLSGGATESNMAKMFNNYGSSRNNINTQLARNLADLNQEYNNNVSSAQQLHDSQSAEAYNNYLNNLTQLGLAKANAAAQYFSPSAYSGMASYMNALANLSNTGAYTPTQNTLGVDSISTTSANNMGSVTDYAKWKAMVDSMSKAGARSEDIITSLLNQGAPNAAIYQLFGVA